MQQINGNIVDTNKFEGRDMKFFIWVQEVKICFMLKKSSKMIPYSGWLHIKIFWSVTKIPIKGKINNFISTLP